MDVGGTKIASALVELESLDELPQVGPIYRIPCNAHEGGDAVLSRITDFARQTASKSDKPIDAIAISTTGTVRESDGSIAYYGDTIPGWTGEPVAEHLTNELGVNAFVLNDLNAYALGEYQYGAGKPFEDILVVASGTGVSAAVISNGKLMLGHNGYAGAFELAQQVSFTYGNHEFASTKNIEEVASGLGIEDCYQELTGKVATGEEVSKLAEAGDVDAAAVIEAAGLALGQCMGHWSNIFDPGAIIVGGSVFNAGPIFDKALLKGFEQGASVLQADTPIVRAELGESAPLVGAAIYAYLKRPAEVSLR